MNLNQVGSGEEEQIIKLRNIIFGHIFAAGRNHYFNTIIAAYYLILCTFECNTKASGINRLHACIKEQFCIKSQGAKLHHNGCLAILMR